MRVVSYLDRSDHDHDIKIFKSKKEAKKKLDQWIQEHMDGYGYTKEDFCGVIGGYAMELEEEWMYDGHHNVLITLDYMGIEDEKN